MPPLVSSDVPSSVATDILPPPSLAASARFALCSSDGAQRPTSSREAPDNLTSIQFPRPWFIYYKSFTDALCCSLSLSLSPSTIPPPCLPSTSLHLSLSLSLSIYLSISIPSNTLLPLPPYPSTTALYLARRSGLTSAPTQPPLALTPSLPCRAVGPYRGADTTSPCHPTLPRS